MQKKKNINTNKELHQCLVIMNYAIETINSILGVRAYVGAEKPTNGEFIALVADKMLLERT